MTSSADFWARKLAKQNPQPVVQPRPDPNMPWWQQVPAQPTQPTQIQQQPETVQQEGEYNPRKLMHKKGSGTCPDCGGDNYYRVTPSSAPRCFECGYVEGRSIADPNRPIGGATEGAPSQKARQTAAGGARIDNYHGNISTASEAVSYIGGV